MALVTTSSTPAVHRPPLYHLAVTSQEPLPSSCDVFSPARTTPNYRLTAEHLLQILGYRGALSDDELLVNVLTDTAPRNDSVLWSQQHTADARQAHHLFRPTVQRLQVGRCVSATDPWLMQERTELLWAPEHTGRMRLGEVLYKAPYSKILYRTPLPAHDIELACAGAVKGWTRPWIDYMVWTPSGSAYVTYDYDTSILYRPATDDEDQFRLAANGVTLRTLWDDFIYPRVSAFYRSVLEPAALQARARESGDVTAVDAADVYAVPARDYITVTDAEMTPEELVAACMRQS